MSTERLHRTEDSARFEEECIEKYSWVLDASPHMEQIAKAANIGALFWAPAMSSISRE
jgi:hypothetical protein